MAVAFIFRAEYGSQVFLLLQNLQMQHGYVSILQALRSILHADIHHDRQYPGTEDPYQKNYEVVQAVEAY